MPLASRHKGLDINYHSFSLESTTASNVSRPASLIMASHDLEKKEGDTLTQVHTLQDDPASLVGGDEALKLFRELGHDPSNLDALTSKFDEAYMRRLTRKLDLILLPILAMTYWLQFLDKSSNRASFLAIRDRRCPFRR